MSLGKDWRARAAQIAASFDTATSVGVLHLPTGRIVLGEPMLSVDLVPLSRAVPPGEYLVELRFWRVEADEDRIAAARIVLSSRPVASWEVAVGASNASTPAANGQPGYRGPAGMFMDVHIAPAFFKYVEECESVEWWREVPRQQGHIWEHACFRPDEHTTYTCAYMSPLLSDDVFVSYWGLDAGGAPAVLLTDFNVLPG
jgi:hypothetical protein